MKHPLLAALLLALAATAAAQQSDTTELRGWKKYWNSLIHGNVDRTHEKKLDISFVVAPCYTKEGGGGVGGAATGLYRLDRSDSIMQPSDISLSGSAQVNGLYVITARGNNHFRGNKSRLSYQLEFMRKDLDFWGVTYDDCAANAKSGYIKQQLSWKSDYFHKLADSFYLGAVFNVGYSHLTGIADRGYLRGQRLTYFFTGVGVSLQYDSRDFIPNPKRGFYLLLRETVYPSFLGSFGETIFSTTLIADYYRPLWRGCVLATDFYAQLTGSHAPWPLREELGSGSSRMRGYYAGRYIDCSQIAVQAELRQHLYRRLGCAAWVGGGTVFPSLGRLRLGNVLPNYGVGLRFEFKRNVNIRVDYGFGKDAAGLVCQFAEAF